MNQSVIIPIGSHEQHGQHLPPNTDYLIARAIAEEIKKQINMEIDMGISVSYSPEHLDFEETKSISKEEFINQVIERLSLYDKKKIRIIINAHGGNSQILENLKKKNQISFTL
ncbi:MAG: creatininase family protein, partial [Candidatus Helarchaeota archaeon]